MGNYHKKYSLYPQKELLNDIKNELDIQDNESDIVKFKKIVNKNINSKIKRSNLSEKFNNNNNNIKIITNLLNNIYDENTHNHFIEGENSTIYKRVFDLKEFHNNLKINHIKIRDNNKKINKLIDFTDKRYKKDDIIRLKGKNIGDNFDNYNNNNENIRKEDSYENIDKDKLRQKYKGIKFCKVKKIIDNGINNSNGILNNNLNNDNSEYGNNNINNYKNNITNEIIFFNDNDNFFSNGNSPNITYKNFNINLKKENIDQINLNQKVDNDENYDSKNKNNGELIPKNSRIEKINNINKNISNKNNYNNPNYNYVNNIILDDLLESYSTDKNNPNHIIQNKYEPKLNINNLYEQKVNNFELNNNNLQLTPDNDNNFLLYSNNKKNTRYEIQITKENNFEINKSKTPNNNKLRKRNIKKPVSKLNNGSKSKPKIMSNNKSNNKSNDKSKKKKNIKGKKTKINKYRDYSTDRKRPCFDLKKIIKEDRDEKHFIEPSQRYKHLKTKKNDNKNLKPFKFNLYEDY